jgi:membrane protein implicated in regulation of membrane protease activity
VQELGKLLCLAGLAIMLIGLFLWSGVGNGWFGRLPGDIAVHRGNVRFYFPIVTCLILSALLSFVLWLFRRP